MSESEEFITLEPHPLSQMFPAMLPEQFEALCQNIQIHGLIHPIVLYQNKILDGVNRYNACVKEQVEISTIDFTGTEQEAFYYVINSNLHRRELSESQRAMCVYDVHQTKGKMRINDPSYTQEFLAEKFNVSTRMVGYAFSLMRSGNQELIGAVRTGTMPVKVAATLLKADDEKRTKALLDPDNATKVVKEINRNERANKIANKTANVNTKLITKLYNVIYADPPWDFEPYSKETGNEKSAENHYDTMETQKILDMEIPAAEDCVLFLWVTIPFLDKGIEAMESWGFEYKSAWFWDKQTPGTGFWFRNQIEMILVGTKGNIPAPLPGDQPKQLISELKTAHSRKPDIFANEIARLYPNMAKLEMFARRPRLGWDIYGNEIKDGFQEDKPMEEFVQERLDAIPEEKSATVERFDDVEIEVDASAKRKTRRKRSSS